MALQEIIVRIVIWSLAAAVFLVFLDLAFLALSPLFAIFAVSAFLLVAIWAGSGSYGR